VHCGATSSIVGNRIEARLINRIVEAPSARPRAYRPPFLTGLGSIIAVGVGAGVVSAIVAISQLLILAPILVFAILLALPSLATAVFVVLLYTNGPSIAANLHGVPYLVAAGFVGLLCIPVFREIVHRRPLIVHPVVGFIALYVLVLLASTLHAADFDVALESTTAHITDGALVVFLLTNAIRSRRDLRWATLALLASAIAICALVAHQWLVQSYEHDYWGFAQIKDAVEIGAGRFVPRSGGPIGEVNRWGQVLTMTLPLMLYAAIAERRLKWIALAGAALVMLALILTFSRGALIAVVALGLIAIPILRIRFRYALPAMAIAFVVVISIAPAYFERIGSVSSATEEITQGEEASDTSILGRLTLNIAAAQVFVENPIVGVGPENFPVVSLERLNELGLQHFTIPYRTHSLYLQVAAETGILGLAAFGSLLGYLFVQLWRVRRTAIMRHAAADAQLAAAYFFSLAAYAVSGLFLHMAYDRYFWLFVGLASVAITVLRHEPVPQAGASPRAGHQPS
jgi:putative inorganic carbon (HCO3(-)) transporter